MWRFETTTDTQPGRKAAEPLFRLAGILAAVGLPLLSGGNAIAQAADGTDEPRWRQSAQAGIEYTDNRDGSETNLESSCDIRVGLRETYGFRNGVRTRLDVTVAPTVKRLGNPRVESDDTEQQKNTRLFGALELDLLHGLTPRATLHATDSLAYGDSLRIAESGAAVRRNAAHLQHTVTLKTDVQVSDATGIALAGKGESTRYDDSELAAESDSDRWNGDAGVARSIGRGYKALGGVGLSLFEDGAVERDRSSRVLAFNGGLEKTFSPDETATVSLGRQLARYASSDLEDESMLSASAECFFRATQPTRFNLAADYGFRPANVPGYSVQKTRSLTGAVEHDVIPDRLTARLRGQISDGRYERESPEKPEGSDRMALIRVQGRYRLSRYCALSGGCSLENWDSLVRESFTRKVLDISLEAEF